MKQITLLFLILLTLTVQAQTKLLSSVDQFNDNGNFENIFGYNYEYDTNDNLITESGFDWDSSNSTWVPSNRDSYLYNSGGRATQLVSQIYDSNSGNFVNDFRDLYTYDSSNNPVEVVFQEFVNGSYQNEFRLTAAYSNNRLVSFIEYGWNGSQWVPEDRGTVNYNSNGTISSIIGEENNNGTWMLDYRDSYTYNSNMQLSEKIFEIWNGSSYDLDEELFYTYDNNGNLTIEEFDFDFSTTGPSGRETYLYDTSELMSNIANPFVDKTGLEYLFDDYPYVNKVLEERYQDYDSNTSSYNDISSKRIYNYNSTLSIQEENAPVVTVQVYPNPTTDFIQIESSNFQVDHVDVYSVLGNKVLSSNETKVNLSALTTGMYFFTIYDVAGNVSNHKVVKE